MHETQFSGKLHYLVHYPGYVKFTMDAEKSGMSLKFMREPRPSGLPDTERLRNDPLTLLFSCCSVQLWLLLQKNPLCIFTLALSYLFVGDSNATSYLCPKGSPLAHCVSSLSHATYTNMINFVIRGISFSKKAKIHAHLLFLASESGFGS